MSTTSNDDHWLELVTQCKSSGLTDRQWCIQNFPGSSGTGLSRRLLLTATQAVPGMPDPGFMYCCTSLNQIMLPVFPVFLCLAASFPGRTLPLS